MDVRRPTLCPDCGAFVRMTWTENCGACGSDLALVEDRVAPVRTEGLPFLLVALEWLSRPRHVIAGAVGTVVLGSLAIIAYALSTVQGLEMTGTQSTTASTYERGVAGEPPVLRPRSAEVGQ